MSLRANLRNLRRWVKLLFLLLSVFGVKIDTTLVKARVPGAAGPRGARWRRDERAGAREVLAWCARLRAHRLLSRLANPYEPGARAGGPA